MAIWRYAAHSLGDADQDSFPMKPLEALSMEKAVLVFSVQALAEMVVPEETGIVFAKGDLINLADRLERLIRDADLRQTFGRNARDWVERNRTWERTASTAKMVLDGFLD
ncbi:glycosyltransferase [Xanthobacter variabilis]|uniref:glycosyltransferase n=1 Tax=Xanthobacter variabilis TaxID=3119932 RepID=UPI00372BDADA